MVLSGLLWSTASATAADTPKTFYLRNSGSPSFTLTLSETQGTLMTEVNNATNKTLKDTTINSTTVYSSIGTWGFAGLLPNQALTDLGSASLWVGLVTTDSVGLKSIVKVEVLKNSTVISTAESACLSLARVPASAASIDLPAPASPVHFGAADTLALRLSAKVCLPGHAAGLIRLHYNRSDRNSNFAATVNPDADLSISKTDSPDPVTAGQNLTYTVTVTNNGPNTASGVTVSDTLPGNVALVSATPSQGSCSGTTTVSCSLGTIDNGGSATVTIVVTVSSEATGPISNTASASANEPDPSTPNQATATTTVIPVTPAGADLSVDKTDSPDPVLQNQELTYTVTVHNGGPAQATGVTLTDTLPAGVVFVSVSPDTPTCTQASGTVTCNLGSIDNGSDSVVTIKVKPGAAAAEAGTITNSATVSSTSSDPNSGNNTATADTAVTKDTDEDGIPDNLDCTPNLADDIVVGPPGVVPDTFTGTRYDTLQAAVNAALDNQVISMYADTTENVVIGDSTVSGGKDLLIIGCGHRVFAASSSLPVIHVEISAGANDGDTGAGDRDIEFRDVDVRNGSGGYLIETSKVGGAGTDTLLKTIRAESSSGVGVSVVGSGNEVDGANGVKFHDGIAIQVIGDSNLITENRATDNDGAGIVVIGGSNLIEKNKIGDGGHGNGAGIAVSGNSNQLLENDVFENSGSGITVSGNSNLIKKNDVGDGGKGNLGDGIHVSGLGNTIDQNNVFANTGDGIDVSGGTAASPNVVKNNDVGDRGKGNGGNGILYAGAGNGTTSPGPVEIENNTVKSNVLAGIKVTGTACQIKNNVSGGSGDQTNGDCEYDLASGNIDAGGNDADGAGVALTIPGCTGTP
jgi:uncharacterized repeat protein (TIGR01451 family)